MCYYIPILSELMGLAEDIITVSDNWSHQVLETKTTVLKKLHHTM